jgi:hypothetical protein
VGGRIIQSSAPTHPGGPTRPRTGFGGVRAPGNVLPTTSPAQVSSQRTMRGAGGRELDSVEQYERVEAELDRNRECWVGSDGHAYDGSRHSNESRSPIPHAISGEG